MKSSFLAVFYKELLQIRRNPGIAFFAVMMPLLQLGMYGFIDQTVHDVPTIVVDQDHSAASRELIDRVRATKTFEVLRVTDSMPHARAEIAAGRANVAILVPPSYRKDRARGEPSKLLVLIDGSDSIVSSGALAAINGLVADQNLRASHVDRSGRSVPLLAAQPVILFNPDGKTANFIIPGLVAVLLQMIAMMLAAGSIVRERETGTLEQLLVAPVDPLGLMLGKVAPYLFLGLGEAAFTLCFMRFAFGVGIRGSLLFLFAVLVVYLIGLLAFGLFISANARTQQEAQQQAQMLFLPSVFLSGYLFPQNGLPLVLQAVGQALPATHMVAILRGVVLRDAGPGELGRHLLALALFALLMIGLSVRRVKAIQGSV